MNSFYMMIALILLVTMLLGLVRVMRGPSRVDRMLAAQLLGTSSVGILLLLALAFEQSALRDVALVFALLAAVSGLAFVRVWAAGVLAK
ncbi:monovalent cation/H+ antiporter complex subunit F [Thiomicrospira microaerophila]|uniref:monovalent cation/H+ antiporter complex subunit F n=1 Tax=Thiomicrospira microaerophila TaxID=406020 RepID=UPI0005C903F6|nr:monovalent cation/H+ antiporter complex subunit F [Thiomicrospira microaerophila]